MGVGVLFLCVIMIVFVVTHMINFDSGVDSLELAATVALILFAGFVVYWVMYFVRGLL
jgi:hypothetical protein